MQYVMYFGFVHDVMFSCNGVNWLELKTASCLVKFPGWRQWRRSCCPRMQTWVTV